jgi:hypothetical protein
MLKKILSRTKKLSSCRIALPVEAIRRVGANRVKKNDKQRECGKQNTHIEKILQSYASHRKTLSLFRENFFGF